MGWVNGSPETKPRWLLLITGQADKKYPGTHHHQRSQMSQEYRAQEVRPTYKKILFADPKLPSTWSFLYVLFPKSKPTPSVHCTISLDEEKSKHAGLAPQQNVFTQLFCTGCWGCQKAQQSLTPVVEQLHALTGSGGLLLVVSFLPFAVQVSVLWVGLRKIQYSRKLT
jgi:hypothetical protein